MEIVNPRRKERQPTVSTVFLVKIGLVPLLYYILPSSIAGNKRSLFELMDGVRLPIFVRLMGMVDMLVVSITSSITDRLTW